MDHQKPHQIHQNEFPTEILLFSSVCHMFLSFVGTKNDASEFKSPFFLINEAPINPAAGEIPIPSGKHTKNYGKSPFLMGKSTNKWPFSIAMFDITRAQAIPSHPKPPPAPWGGPPAPHPPHPPALRPLPPTRGPWPQHRNHAGSGGWNHYWAVWTYNGGIRLLSIHVHPKSVDHTYCTGDEIRIDWQGHPNSAMIFQVYFWCQNLSPWRGLQSWPSAESTEPSSHQ